MNGCNILLAIIIIIIIIAIIIYLKDSSSDASPAPAPAPETIQPLRMLDEPYPAGSNRENHRYYSSYPANQPILETRRRFEPTMPMEQVIGQQNVNQGEFGSTGTFRARNPNASNQAPFNNYGVKRQITLPNMDHPYGENTTEEESDNERSLSSDNQPRYSPRSDQEQAKPFMKGKKKFLMKSREEIEDQYNADHMLPKETEEDWFDAEPLMHTKKVSNSHLINPKVHMSINQVGTRLGKNGTRDFRGDVPNPKMNISPWNNSTIQPGINLRGICNGV